MLHFKRAEQTLASFLLSDEHCVAHTAGAGVAKRMKNSKIIVMIWCLMTPGLMATAYRWGSMTGATLWNGATTGGIIAEENAAFDTEDLPVTADGGSTATQIGIFKPRAADSLTLVDKVRIKGDVEIRFDGEHDAGVHEVFTINIGTGVGASPVTVSAYTDEDTTVAGYSQLVFNPAQGKTIVVNVYTDVTFTSVDALVGFDPDTPGSTGAPLPLFVTFRGKGSTVFRLPSGKSIRFGPPSPGHTAFEDVEATSPLSATGVHVRVYMEQGSLDVYGDGRDLQGRSQVVFEKWSYFPENPETEGAVNTDTDQDTWITFGQLSSFAFFSDNYLGISESWNDLNGDGEMNLGEPTFQAGYGSIAFDPSNYDTGRLILQLCRGQSPLGNDFTDAGFNVYGALLVPRVFSSSRGPASVFNADFRTGVYFNQRAGVKAHMRVVDDVAHYERVESEGADLTAEEWLLRPVADRRGLVIINHSNSIPYFANNYDGALSIDASVWGQFNDYQPGFVIGVNGIVSVAPHTFLDYLANNSNIPISASHGDTAGTHAADKVKRHNPAALYTETLPQFERRSNHGLDQFNAPISDLLYVGHLSRGGSHPVIELQGNGGLFVRSAAAYNDQAIPRVLFLQPLTNEFYYLQPYAADTSKAVTIALGIGVYDGCSVSVLDSANRPVMQSIELDGAHALDIEGVCTIASRPGLRGEPAAGFFMVPSLEIDYAGRELGYENFEVWAAWQAWLDATPGREETVVFLPVSGEHVTFNAESHYELVQSPLSLRPLDVKRYYAIYDVSSLFLNANLVFDGVTWVHADVTRKQDSPAILPQPFFGARPHVVGAELASLRDELYPPLIKLYNSRLECHESLVITGAALTVHECAAQSAAEAHNTARIVCYNRGRLYDTSGYGRVIQLGSQANVAADGATTRLLYNSAFLDVYRSAPTADASAEEPTVIRCLVESTGEPTVSPAERSLHVLYLANGSQIHLGWPTLEGDSGYVPALIDSKVLAQLQAHDPANKNLFRFSPYSTGVGHLQFQGGPFYVGAGDGVDALPPERPIPGIDVDGVVYTNFGGKLSAAGSTDLFFDTVVARRKASLPACSGVVAFPRDQVHFLSNGALQDYDIDFMGDRDLREGDGLLTGNVVVNVDDSVYAFDVAQLYETFDVESVK